MARQVNPLVRFAQTNLDTNGNGFVELRVPNYGESWRIDGATVEVSPANLEPTAKVYLDGRMIGGTYTGALSSARAKGVMQMSQVLRCEWTGGDPGALATFTISGEQIIG
jgi:hypothetical protein